MAISYKVVFDVNNNFQTGTSTHALSLVALAVFCLALTAAMSAIFLKCFQKWSREHIFSTGVILLLFLAGACAVSFQLTQVPSLLTKEINEHPENITSIEGVVSRLTEKLKLETFCVREVCFSYDDNLITGGFNRTLKWGGPIKNGLYVRVQYIRPENTILRLEIAAP